MPGGGIERTRSSGSAVDRPWARTAFRELCGFIEDVCRAFDEAKTLGDWLDADDAMRDIVEEGVWLGSTEDGWVVELGLPNPHDESARFPDIEGPSAPSPRQPRPDSTVSHAWRRFERATERYFEDPESPEAQAELDAAGEAMNMPPSLFEAPMCAARTEAWERLGLHEESRQQELDALIEAREGRKSRE